MKTLKVAWLIKTSEFPFNKEKHWAVVILKAVLQVFTQLLEDHLFLHCCPWCHTIGELLQGKTVKYLHYYSCSTNVCGHPLRAKSYPVFWKHKEK